MKEYGISNRHGHRGEKSEKVYEILKVNLIYNSSIMYEGRLDVINNCVKY